MSFSNFEQNVGDKSTALVMKGLGFLQKKRIRFPKKNPIRPFCENRIRNIILIFFEISPKNATFSSEDEHKELQFFVVIIFIK